MRAGDGQRALGVVLAGGGGSRLGGDKALVELGGRPLIAHPLAHLAEAGIEAVVVAKPDSRLPPLDCAVIEEPAEPRHPLCGIVAAMRHAPERTLVAIACDMPFAGPGLLGLLAEMEEPLAVCAVGTETQPLPGRFEPALLSPLEGALERREPLRRTVESLRPRILGGEELERFGDPARLCFNVNSPADLERAAAMLQQD
jgi:molybdopterin-guanine dinucleotide biosynthesis protein A